VGHQAAWLFGGQTVVMETAGLTSADYARRGFFELAMVSAMVLPMLLAFRWAMGPAVTTFQDRLYTALSATLLGLVALVIASAAHRMALYQASFGLTEMRVFVLAFEAWMVGLLAWFGASVLRGKAERFALGALVTFLVTVADLTLLGIGAPFWGLVIGLAVAWLLERGDFARP
jgi:predicted benzoate:H+ symporter BenE